MWIMAAHEMMTLGGTVSGTVDASYEANSLVNGDPADPVRVTAGSLSLAVTGTSQAINCMVVANHNLLVRTVTFSGIGTVTTPTVPPGNIRKNGVTILTSETTRGTTTVSVTSPSPIIIGDAQAGYVREIRTFPPRPDTPHRPFNVTPDGEFHVLSYSKGAVSRNFGGSVFLDTAMKEILDNAWEASEQNSLPTVIIPIEDVNDAWLVTWLTYNPKPYLLQRDLWHVDVVWQELPRYRWPA